MAKFNAAKITSKMSKLAGNRYFVAIRDGMAVIIPVAIVGSFFTIISQFPKVYYSIFTCITSTSYFFYWYDGLVFMLCNGSCFG